jgi:hypothetical protein
VEPEPVPAAPRPLTAIELDASQRLHVLLQTLTWTQTVSRSIAVKALGPCYLLSKVIERPADEALDLRAKAEKLCEALERFIQR